MPETNTQINENAHDKDLRAKQDEALKTPGYSDDPHIESSNRSPKNDSSKMQEGGGNESGSGEQKG